MRRSVLRDLSPFNYNSSNFDFGESKRNSKLLSHNSNYDSMRYTPNSIICIIGLYYFSITQPDKNIILAEVLKMSDGQSLKHRINNTPCRSPNMFHKNKIIKVLQHLQKCLDEGDYNQILNDQDEAIFILTILLRHYCSNYYLNKKLLYKDDAMGNEIDVLQNYHLEPKNVALAIVADALAIQLTIINKIDPKANQKYGKQANKTKLSIKLDLNQTPPSFQFNLNSGSVKNVIKKQSSKLLPKDNIGLKTPLKLLQHSNSKHQLSTENNKSKSIQSKRSKFEKVGRTTKNQSPKVKCSKCNKGKVWCVCNTIGLGGLENKQMDSIKYSERVITSSNEGASAVDNIESQRKINGLRDLHQKITP